MATNLVPMAGEGKRFKDAGYKTGKPMIPVSGKPMILSAIEGMPSAKDWIFVCRKEHLEEDRIDKAIKKAVKNARFIPIDYLTEGQLCTCLLARDFLPDNEPIFIGSCDNGMVWDRKKYSTLLKEKDTDIVVWAFTRQINLLVKPTAWGWLKLKNDKKTIEDVSVKVPVSENPYNDYAVIGAFTFKDKKTFLAIADDMIKNNVRVNNEFYVDSAVSHGIKMGYTAKVFVVDQYIGWGTPQDLWTYEFWEKYFKKGKKKRT